MSAWIEKFIDVNPHTRSGKKLTDVKKLVVHYTANNGGTAMNHYNYFNNLKDRYASAHIFVDKKEAICIIPLNEVAFHAGDVQKRNADGSPYRGVKELLPSANYLSIGVEMCVEKDGTFHADTIERTENVFVELCKKFKLDPLKDIVRHYDVTAKDCPSPWVKDKQKFIDFKQRVNAKLNPPKKEEVKPIEKSKPTPKPKFQLVYKRLLKEGMDGTDVKQLQKALNILGFNCGKEDGDFGKLAKAAVIKLQKKYLPHEVDGMAGKHVIAKINSLLK